MRVEITYYAFDETEFDTEEECRDYEQNLLSKFKAVSFFDSNRRLLETPSLQQIESEAVYMLIKSKSGAEDLFEWLQEQISWEPVNCSYSTGDILYFVDDRWKNLTTDYRVLKTKLEAIQTRAKQEG